MVVLLLFNEADECAIDTIASSTSLEKKELQRTVRSLIATKLLTSSVPLGDTDDDIPATCTVRFNAKFKSKKKRMR